MNLITSHRRSGVSFFGITFSYSGFLPILFYISFCPFVSSVESQKLEAPYDVGNSSVNGLIVSEKLTEAAPMKVYRVENAKNEERICISFVKGDTDNVEIVVRDSENKRVGDYRLACEHNLGFISVPTNGKAYTITIVRSNDSVVKVEFRLTKLSKEMIKKLNKETGVQDDDDK